MAFKGTLKEFKVPDILQLISLQKKTGILTFNSLEGFITLIFEEGSIVGVDAFPKKLEMRVGNVCVKQEIISEEMLQRALAIQKRTNQKVGEILIGMGLIDEKIIPEMLKIQAVQIVLSLFNWKKGDYNFKILDHINNDLKLFTPIAVDTLIMEGVQMLDEWPSIKKVIPNEDIVFEPVYLGSKKIELVSEYDDDRSSKDNNTIFLSEIELNLLKHINGKNKVKDLVEMGLFTEYKIYKKLFNLFNKGLMKKKEKTEIQEIQERKLFADLRSSNDSKLDRLFDFFLALLILSLLLTFFTPLQPIHKKNLLLKTPAFQAIPAPVDAGSIAPMKFRTRLEKTSGASAVAIGNFDGFHAGHNKIIETLRTTARRDGLHSVILTFHPHPRVYFKQPIQLISTDRQRLEILRRQGPDYLFFIDFSSIADCPAAAFVERILLGTLQMKVLIIGHDFRFGRDREGDLAFLRERAAQAPFKIIRPRTLCSGGTRIASSIIRKKLAAGEIEAANRILGHPYAIEGVVEQGAGRGKKLGFPTLNISTANQILPSGVFHTQTVVGKKCWPSVTNVGSAPTFADDVSAPVKIETHIPGFRRMIYGENVTILFIRKIRPEIKFDSSRSLVDQIRLDVASLKI